MGEIVTLELPDKVARSAKSIATRTHRRLEDVLIDWIDQAAAELPVDSLSDEEILKDIRQRGLLAELAQEDPVVRLLNDWVSDESGYDEHVWPTVKESIETHRLSERKRFGD